MVNTALTRDWASGHFAEFDQCPLCPRKRTLFTAARMSALCHKRTHALQQTAAYSITSSAAFNRSIGTPRPSVLAVLRLITSSNLVGA
jgi:hypothetical protein